MATFTGTNKELHLHLGSRFTKLVQQITYKPKRISACQHCASLENLESAHKQGRSRPEIINSIASQYVNQSGFISFDCAKFEKEFIAEHVPLEKAILILCRTCHQKYDKASNKSLEQNRSFIHEAENVLPITLKPPNAKDFRDRLLQTRQAEIKIFYNNGEARNVNWDAKRFRQTSNVMGNLRSRKEFRSGEWRRNGIVAVHVRVLA